MAKRVISIEISQSITRVIEMDYQIKNPKLYNLFSFETPKGVVEEGIIKENDLFVQCMKDGMKKNGIHTNKAVFTITAGKIASREITLPLMKEKRLQEVVAANAQEYFPVDLSKYQVKYMTLDKVETGEVQGYNLVILAIPNEVIQSHEEMAKACGLQIESIDYVGNSIIEVMRREEKDENVAVIKMDETTSLITIFEGQKVAFQRNIAYGINEAIEVLQQSEVFGKEMSYVETMNMMRRKSCIRRHLDVEANYREEEDVDFEITTMRLRITECLRPCIRNIARVLDFFASRNKDVPIEKIILIGLGADFSGLSKLLTNELGIKTVSLQQTSVVTVENQGEQEVFKIAECMACIGATLHPLDLRYQLLEQGKTGEKHPLQVPFTVFGICAVVSIGLMVVPLILNSFLARDIRKLEQEKAQLEYIEIIYNDYLGAKSESEELVAMYEETTTPNEQLISFIEEMEEKMPSDLTVISFTGDTIGVNMNIKVNSKTSAAKVLVELRKFETLEEVYTSGITEITDEIGSSYVEFAVRCTYRNATIDEIEEIEETVVE